MRDQFDLILDLLWNLAPEWVNWIAIDQNGAIYGYSSKPEQSSRGTFWVVQSQEYDNIRKNNNVDMCNCWCVFHLHVY